MRALAAKPETRIEVEHIAPIRASVRDAVETVLAALPPRDVMTFRQLVADAPTRLETIVRFLAVLELYKQGVIDLEQFDTFGELRLRRLREGETALDAASLAEWDDDTDEVVGAAEEAETNGERAQVSSEPE